MFCGKRRRELPDGHCGRAELLEDLGRRLDEERREQVRAHVDHLASKGQGEVVDEAVAAEAVAGEEEDEEEQEQEQEEEEEWRSPRARCARGRAASGRRP